MVDSTRPLLPVVQEAISASIEHHFFGGTDSDRNKRASQVLDRFRQDFEMIRKENPEIAKMIDALQADPKSLIAIRLCGVSVYLALRSQAEADRMLE